MIEAYLDESGIHSGAKICVIAGYFGGQGQMRKLEKAWSATLQRFSFPLKKFHAKDLLKQRKHRPMLEALALIVGQQRKVYPASYGLVVDDFNSFSLSERRFMTGATLSPTSGKLESSGCPGKPYFVPFQNVVKLVTDCAPIGSKAHFSFGIDRPFAEYALAWFREINETSGRPKPYSTWKSRDRLGTALFPRADETPQLQAADLLVHLTYLHMEKYVIEGKHDGPSDLLQSCLGNMRSLDNHVYQDKACLQEVIEQARSLCPTWRSAAE